MCRLLGYLGAPISLDRLLYQPNHSLVVQSYQPQEMTSGLLNADGFGIGWYHSQRQTEPFLYRNTLPIWNDVNLPHLSRYIESGCVLANVRSATPGLAVDLSNCQPFQQNTLLGIHNGFIDDFRQTLYRPMRDRLSDNAYQWIQGLTDSEHLFAFFMDELSHSLTLVEALQRMLIGLTELATKTQTGFSANLILSNGEQLVVSRYAYGREAPSLYYLRHHPQWADARLIASEPLFAGDWQLLPDRSIATVTHDLDLQLQSF